MIAVLADVLFFTRNISSCTRCRDVNSYQVYPWVHQYMNNLKPEHQTQAVSFPDVSPSDLPRAAQFSMTAGDFLEVMQKILNLE